MNKPNQDSESNHILEHRHWIFCLEERIRRERLIWMSEALRFITGSLETVCHPQFWKSPCLRLSFCVTKQGMSPCSFNCQKFFMQQRTDTFPMKLKTDNQLLYTCSSIAKTEQAGGDLARTVTLFTVCLHGKWPFSLFLYMKIKQRRLKDPLPEPGLEPAGSQHSSCTFSVHTTSLDLLCLHTHTMKIIHNTKVQERSNELNSDNFCTLQES